MFNYVNLHKSDKQKKNSAAYGKVKFTNVHVLKRSLFELVRSLTSI